ncbi:hypothetical protein [Streptomyces mirabilis]|uniref:hypothetical protein n=1 Tax=Streptomyces mirabilis TaxID=68239 RepID=UPI0036D0EED8
MEIDRQGDNEWIIAAPSSSVGSSEAGVTDKEQRVQLTMDIDELPTVDLSESGVAE